MKLVAFILLFFQSLLVLGQSEIGVTINYSRLDAFHGVEYAYSKNRLTFFTGLEIGINRSYFQKRVFPKLKTGFAYSAVKKEKFKLQPTIQYAYAVLKFNNNPQAFAHYHEVATGIKWRYGKKWQIGQTLLLGPVWERSHNTLYQKSRSSLAFGYTAQIDFIYAF